VKFKAISFDYFGTLVDSDRGGELGMARVLDRLKLRRDAASDYLSWDQHAVRIYRGGRYRPYRIVAREALEATLRDIAPELADEADIAALTELLLEGLVRDSPPHAEVPDILRELRGLCPLLPITNMDTDLFDKSQLAYLFPSVVTAEAAKAYKPSERIFLKALETLALDAGDVLHVSLATWADIEGAKPLGFAVAWINRAQERLGPWTPRPDYELPNLSGLLEIAGTPGR
jgi:2-haloalkanoic acid dehalogenase type II